MSQKIRTVIVDDEEYAREDLKAELAPFEHIQIVGEAAGIDEARRVCHFANPQLVFLDIQMPGETGFDLLQDLDPETKVIFVTAFDKYAIRAFDVNAFDYILKPVSSDRLKQSLERIDPGYTTSVNHPPDLLLHDRIFISSTTGAQFITVGEIAVIRAASDYSNIQLKDAKKLLFNKSMNEWDARLPSEVFVRIHRSTIININFIQRIEAWSSYRKRVFMKGIEEPCIISRNYAQSIKKYYN